MTAGISSGICDKKFWNTPYKYYVDVRKKLDLLEVKNGHRLNRTYII
jgi:hypothetical protein